MKLHWSRRSPYVRKVMVRWREAREALAGWREGFVARLSAKATEAVDG